MKKRLDALDLKILVTIQDVGPRNLTKVAEKVGIDRSSLRFRIKTLMSPFFYLRFFANVYHTNMGLKKAVVFVNAMPGYESILFDCLKANEFWIYLSRFYGLGEGCLGIYTIPKGYESQFARFIEEMKRQKVAKNAEIVWSTCFQRAFLGNECFDEKEQTWIFNWDEWIHEIESERTQLPYTLKDPEDFPILGDETDVFILKELEKDATIDFSELAKKLGVSTEAARYRYGKLMKHNLIEGTEIFLFPFGIENTELYFFKFDFDSQEKMAKFATSLLHKPFASVVGKVLSEYAIIAGIRLPKAEFRKFIDAISELSQRGFIHNFKYVIQDLRKRARQTLAYEFFKDQSWIYDHTSHIETLKRLVKETRRT